jgi:hypothetical protein
MSYETYTKQEFTCMPCMSSETIEQKMPVNSVKVFSILAREYKHGLCSNGFIIIIVMSCTEFETDICD